MNFLYFCCPDDEAQSKLRRVEKKILTEKKLSKVAERFFKKEADDDFS